jgi:hypothetical protein
MSQWTVMNQSFEAQFAPLNGPNWESKENPQNYDLLEAQIVSPTPKRQMLGLIGGNEVATVKESRRNIVNGQQVDIESDLRGITRPLTSAPWRDYQPQALHNKTIERNTTKGTFKVDATLHELPRMQMWAYPASYAPEPLVKETCGRPEKY